MHAIEAMTRTAHLASWILAACGAVACGRGAATPGPAAPEQARGPEPAQPAEPAAVETAAAPPCPVDDAPGLAIDVTEIEGGVALAFRADRDLDQLRADVVSAARAHNRIQDRRAAATDDVEPADRSRSEVGTGNQVGNTLGRDQGLEGGTEGRTGVELPTDTYAADDDDARTYAGTSGQRVVEDAIGVMTPSRAEVEHLEDGARILFAAAAADIPGLRDEVRERADEIRRRCLGE